MTTTIIADQKSMTFVYEALRIIVKFVKEECWEMDDV